MEANFRIGHAKDKIDGRPVYFAFVPKDDEADKKLQDLILGGSPFPGDLDALTKFHVEDKDHRKAARIIRESLTGLPFDPAKFWESRCPWLMN